MKPRTVIGSSVGLLSILNGIRTAFQLICEVCVLGGGGGGGSQFVSLPSSRWLKLANVLAFTTLLVSLL